MSDEMVSVEPLNFQSCIEICRYDGPNLFMWPNRCLVDVIKRLWMEERKDPSRSYLYMIAFKDEYHARACCRNEQSMPAVAKRSYVDFQREFQESRYSTFDPVVHDYIVMIVAIESPMKHIYKVFKRDDSFWPSNVQMQLIQQQIHCDVAPARSWCAGCERYSENLKKCSRCKRTPYCSKACIKEDWERHREFCRKVHSKHH